MNREALLSKAPQTFDNGEDILVYSPRRIKDIYGYQYVIKGTPKSIRGSIHTTASLYDEEFGLFNGATLKISTKSELKLGDIIEYRGECYAIDRGESYNSTMGLYHYNAQSLFDYYKEFIVSDAKVASRVLGDNSMRYLLTMQSDIPLTPALFRVDNPKYFSISIYGTRPLTLTHRGEGDYLTQSKRERVRVLAVGCDTNELQGFCYALQGVENIGLLSYPAFSEARIYNRDFDTKANIWEADFEINYTITGTNPLPQMELIREAFAKLNFKEEVLP